MQVAGITGERARLGDHHAAYSMTAPSLASPPYETNGEGIPSWLPRGERPVYGCPWHPRGGHTDGVEYEGAQAPVREDLREAHRFILDHVRSPGTWWTGAERAAMAAEARAAV